MSNIAHITTSGREEFFHGRDLNYGRKSSSVGHQAWTWCRWSSRIDLPSVSCILIVQFHRYLTSPLNGQFSPLIDKLPLSSYLCCLL